MNIVMDFAIVVLSVALGVSMMRWHENDKSRAVRAEMQRTERWRVECERVRMNYVEANVLSSKSGTDGTWVCVNNPSLSCTTPDPKNITPTMAFGAKDERELRERGGIVKILRT